MKMIEAIIQPSKLEAVKEALHGVEVVRLTISDVQGFGRQKGHTEVYRANIANLHFVSDNVLQHAVDFYGVLEKVRVQVDGLNYGSFKTLPPNSRVQAVELIRLNLDKKERKARRLTAKHRDRLSSALKGKPKPETFMDVRHRAKIGAANRNRTKPSDFMDQEHREKISKSLRESWARRKAERAAHAERTERNRPCDDADPTGVPEPHGSPS